MWACWMVFLLYQPIDPLILSFRLPRSIYYIFTSYHSYGLVGHHSCHVNPLSLTLYSLGFLSPFTSYCSHGFIALFLGLPRPIYYIFTSYHSYGLVGHHSYHVSPLSLPLHSLGFLGPLTSFFFLLLLS